MDIIITQNKIPAVKLAKEKAIQAALEAIGSKAARYAADNSPVDTGRLKRSMTHKVGSGAFGKSYVDIGSNVEYAIYQEFGTRSFDGHHMIRNSVTNHTEEYKRIAESYLEVR